MIKSRLRKNILSESVISGKTIVSVDIQPEYEKIIHFIPKWTRFINESYQNNHIIFLYNGYDSLGMVKQTDYMMWLSELGIDEEVLENSKFYDKGYAFFRYCMDSDIDDEQTVHLIQFMIANNIHDSRDMNKEVWKNFIRKYGSNDVKDLMEHADDMIYIPDLMDFIKKFSGIVLMGGGISECLKEVELALMALNKPYTVLSQFTY